MKKTVALIKTSFLKRNREYKISLFLNERLFTALKTQVCPEESLRSWNIQLKTLPEGELSDSVISIQRYRLKRELVQFLNSDYTNLVYLIFKKDIWDSLCKKRELNYDIKTNSWLCVEVTTENFKRLVKYLNRIQTEKEIEFIEGEGEDGSNRS